MKNRSFCERLQFAFDGVAAAWRREKSFRSQLVVAALVVMVLLYLQVALLWWAIIGLLIVLVLTTELLNSAFEALIDHLHPDQHPEIRVIKDMAAGAVLLASIGALLIGGLLLAATL